MTLHLVFTDAGRRACQPRAQAGDVALLLGDGIYAGTLPEETWPCAVQALAEDAAARGVDERLAVPAISYADFVRLCEQHIPIVSWTD